jgi:hypothetical protein
MPRWQIRLIAVGAAVAAAVIVHLVRRASRIASAAAGSGLPQAPVDQRLDRTQPTRTRLARMRRALPAPRPYSGHLSDFLI